MSDHLSVTSERDSQIDRVNRILGKWEQDRTGTGKTGRYLVKDIMLRLSFTA